MPTYLLFDGTGQLLRRGQEVALDEFKRYTNQVGGGAWVGVEGSARQDPSVVHRAGESLINVHGPARSPSITELAALKEHGATSQTPQTGELAPAGETATYSPDKMHIWDEIGSRWLPVPPSEDEVPAQREARTVENSEWISIGKDSWRLRTDGHIATLSKKRWDAWRVTVISLRTDKIVAAGPVEGFQLGKARAVSVIYDREN